MSIKLGPFTLEHPFLLAPMAGITASPFRRLMRQHKSALVVSELVSANGIEYAGTRTLELLRFHEEERPVGIQIFGENTELLCKAAQLIERLGADFVDLNLGCPVPKIVKKGAGSALCRNPETLGNLLETLVKSVKIPVTIKMRTGWDESSKNALECILVAAQAGVCWVAVHGRTRTQGYSGESDWNLIAELKSQSPIPIIGNGDLNTPELAVERLCTSGVDAVMIGRGALRNPFIFEQSVALWRGEPHFNPTFKEYESLLSESRKNFEEFYSPRLAHLHLRKFLSWFSSGFRDCHEFRKKIFSDLDIHTLWNEVLNFFEKNSASRDTKYLNQPFLMGGHG